MSEESIKWLGSTVSGEGGLMFKVTFTPEGAALDIAVPTTEDEARMLQTATAALVAAMALQLGRSGKVCHAQCVFMNIVKWATRELAHADPAVYQAYCENLLAEAKANGITGGPLSGAPSKKDLH